MTISFLTKQGPPCAMQSINMLKNACRNISTDYEKSMHKTMLTRIIRAARRTYVRTKGEDGHEKPSVPRLRHY